MSILKAAIIALYQPSKKGFPQDHLHDLFGKPFRTYEVIYLPVVSFTKGRWEVRVPPENTISSSSIR